MRSIWVGLELLKAIKTERWYNLRSLTGNFKTCNPSADISDNFPFLRSLPLATIPAKKLGGWVQKMSIFPDVQYCIYVDLGGFQLEFVSISGIITGHVIYNPAYTYKFQLKTTIEGWWVWKSPKLCWHNIGMDPYPMTKGCHQPWGFFACNSSSAWGIFKWYILQGFLDDLSVCT